MIRVAILVAGAALAALLLLLPRGCDDRAAKELTAEIIADIRRSISLGSTRAHSEMQLASNRMDFHKDPRTGEMYAAARSICNTWLVDVGIQFIFKFDEEDRLLEVKTNVMNSGP